MSDFGFYMFLALMIIFTSGEPDLLDGITSKLMQDQCFTLTNDESE